MFWLVCADDTCWSDRSGHLSSGAILTLLNTFDRFDANRDGFWSLEELNTFQVRVSGVSWT